MKTFSRTQMREVYDNWKNTSVGSCQCKSIQAQGVLDFLDYLAVFEFTDKSTKERKVSTADRNKGKIKWFNKDKGFGFITTEDGDVFIHCTAVPGYKEGVLEEGTDVEFDVFNSTKGLQARDVVIL